MSLFAIAPIRDTAYLFGFFEISTEYLQVSDMTESEKRDRKLMLHIRLCPMLEMDTYFCKEMVQNFKVYRANPLLVTALSFYQPLPLLTTPFSFTPAARVSPKNTLLDYSSKQGMGQDLIQAEPARPNGVSAQLFGGARAMQTPKETTHPPPTNGDSSDHVHIVTMNSDTTSDHNQ